MDILAIINQEKLTDSVLNGYVEISDYGNIASWFNTARLRPNQIPRQEVQKQFTVIDIAKLIPASDRVIIQNELNGTYQSVLTNIKSADVESVEIDIENLIASNKLSETCNQILQGVIANLGQKELDPNYEAIVLITPVEEYGLGKVRTQDVMDSLIPQ